LLLFVSENTDVYFNLAAEEYFLKSTDENILMLWRSKHAIVCGKHQNLCSELNYGYCIKNGIQPARRLSGGGTVYHDLGNINFTFIENLTGGLEKAIQYNRYLDPIKSALQHLGVRTEYSERHDLLLNNKKISGNAQHIDQKRKRVLHHGTLLFDANLEHLKNALKTDGRYSDKAVKSVRSEVTNIRNILKDQNSDIFLQNIILYWENQKHTNRYVLCGNDVEEIERLRLEKYATENWILHYSPAYSLSKNLPNSTIEVNATIADGTITNLIFSDGNFDPLPWTGKKLNSDLGLAFRKYLREKGYEADAYFLF
jgi:lipoate-protein ligase A